MFQHDRLNNEITFFQKIKNLDYILLISVNERTKEIGIRRALGATPKKVRNQILIESIFLTLIAGIIGIILATIILFSINYGTKDLTDFPYTNPTVPIEIYFRSFISDDYTWMFNWNDSSSESSKN